MLSCHSLLLGLTSDPIRKTIPIRGKCTSNQSDRIRQPSQDSSTKSSSHSSPPHVEALAPLYGASPFPVLHTYGVPGDPIPQVLFLGPSVWISLSLDCHMVPSRRESTHGSLAPLITLPRALLEARVACPDEQPGGSSFPIGGQHRCLG